MKHRVVEILFRRKLLLLLPIPINMTLAIGAATRPQPPQYQANARAWVDQYVELSRDERLGYAPGPAQAGLLMDFVHTRSFARSVIEKTSLAPLLADQTTEGGALGQFWGSVGVAASSNSFVTITVTTWSPTLSLEIAQALVSKFEETLRARGETQVKLASTLYAQTTEKTRDAAERSRVELATYLAAHPELGRGTDATATARDATLSRLVAQADYDQVAYREAKQRYDQSLTLGAAGLENQTLAFTVVDPPELPTAPLPHGRTALLKLPVVGLALATILSAVTAVLLILTNRSVLGAPTIAGLAAFPVLGEIPVLKRRRWLWQRAPRHGVRLLLSAPAQRASTLGPVKA